MSTGTKCMNWIDGKCCNANLRDELVESQGK
jgi:hypothetical protein